MTRNKEDDNVWGLKKDECSLEFIIDWSIKMEKFS